MSEPLHIVDVFVRLSNGETITHDGLRLEEEALFDLLTAHQGSRQIYLTADDKTINETARIIAIDFSSPHVVGMEVRVLNKEPIE